MDTRTGQEPLSTSSYAAYFRTLSTSTNYIATNSSMAASVDSATAATTTTMVAASPNYTVEQLERARRAATESKPRVFNITNHPRQQLNICVFGCQGGEITFDKRTGEPIITSSYAPSKVARLLNDTVSVKPSAKPDLIILLGDNFYPDGVNSPNDARFEAQFHKIYGDPNLTQIAGVPCAVVLGNHDGGRDTASHIKAWVPFNNYVLGTNPLQCEEAELQQVAHSYLPHPQDPDQSVRKEDLFTHENIDYRMLPKHLMPHFYHSWIFDKVQVFGLNSNTYVKDFLEMIRRFAFDADTDSTDNQAAWLEKEYGKAEEAGRITIFTMHHPLFTAGKRAYKSGFDAKHYLDPKDIAVVNRILQLTPPPDDDVAGKKLFKEQVKALLIDYLDESKEHEFYEPNANYNLMLTTIMCKFQGMSPTMVCTAHDHSIYYYNNTNDPSPTAGPKLRQVVAGGGGSEDLQARSYFGQQENVGCFIKEHGFAMLSCDKSNPEFIDINIHTTHGNHLHFTSDSPAPIVEGEISHKLAQVRAIILDACRDYLTFIHGKQTESNGKFFHTMPSISSLAGLWRYNAKHTEADVTITHDLMNYFNNAHLPGYKDCVIFIFNKMHQLSNQDSENSLYQGINAKIRAVLGKNNIKDLYYEALNSESRATNEFG